MALELLGEHDAFAYQVGCDGENVYHCSTPSSSTGIYRYSFPGLVNTEGSGVWRANTTGRVDDGLAVSASTVFRQEWRSFNNTLYLDTIASNGTPTNVGSDSGISVTNGRSCWNPVTGSVWNKSGFDLYEWVSGVRTSRHQDLSAFTSTAVPHVDSTGAVWFARDAASDGYEVCRYDSGTVTVVYSFTRTSLITVTGAQNNSGLIYDDQFVFNENGTWKQVTAGGSVSNADVMDPAPLPAASPAAGYYTDSYCAAPDQNAGFVIAFEGTHFSVGARQVWGFAPAGNPWRVGRVGWGTRGAWS